MNRVLFCLLTVLCLVSPLRATEKVVNKTATTSIVRSVDNYNEFNRLGKTNAIHAFWFKRANTTDTSPSFYNYNASTLPQISINTDGYLVYGTNVTSAYVEDTDWHYFSLLYKTKTLTTNITGGCWATENYVVDVELRLNNSTIYTKTNVSMMPYSYRISGATCTNSSIPGLIFVDHTMLSGFTGYIDDYVVAVDLSDTEITRLYQVGARILDSNDDRVINYWADEVTFSDYITSRGTIVDGDKPILSYVVTIQSDYGLSKLTPAPGSDGTVLVDADAVTEFTAPNYIYLDRYGNELAGTTGDIRDRAFYRLVNDGYSAAGNTFQGIPTTSFTLDVDSDLTVSWFWKKEYALIIESSTADIEGVSDDDFSGLGNPSHAIQKHWLAEDTLFTTAIDGIINQSNAPVRFSSTGFVIENDPDTTDRYIVLNGTNDYLTMTNALPLTDMNNFTIEFWARRDPRTTTEDEDIFCIGEGTGSPKFLRVGFRSSGNNAEFFIAHTNGTVIASADDGYTDSAWHHWAWVYNSTNSQLNLYRDAELINSFTTAISFDGSVTNGVAYQYYKGSVIYPDAAYTSSAQTSSGSDQTVYEAEAASSSVNMTSVNLGSDNGSSMRFGTSSASLTWTNIAGTGAQRLLNFRLSASGIALRTATVRLNGNIITNFFLSGNFDNHEVVATLANGNNTIQVSATSVDDTSIFDLDTWVYIDQMVVWSEESIGSLSEAFTRWSVDSSGTNSTFSLSPTNQSDRIGFKFTTQLRVDQAGSYTFYTTSDDGSALFVNGAKVVDNDGAHASQTRSGTTNLSAGLHSIEVQYFEFTGGDGLTVQYSGPDTGNVSNSLPAAKMFPTGDMDSGTIGASMNTNHFYKGALNNLRLWNTVRSEAELEASMTTTAYGAGVSGLVLEMTFDDPGTTSITSSQGYVATMRNFDSLFPSGTSASVKHEALFPSFAWTERTNIIGRIQTDEFSIQDWMRVTWLWERQFRLRVSAADLDFQGFPFVTTENGTIQGSTAEEVWVPEYSAVTVGTQYRADDRCHTLKGISGQTGALRTMTMNTVEDGTLNGKATRQYVIAALTNYGDVVFTYDRTIFRAEIPLGKGLDVSSTAILNAQLVPDLCSGAALHLTGNGPTNLTSNPVLPEAASGGTTGSSGRRILYDKVGQQLLPLMPGTFLVDWRDANDPTTSYLIEVVSHFPTETLDIYYDREDENGYREGTHPSYVTEVTFDEITDEFPGSPETHYRHFYSVANDAPPIDLDVNDADRWHFDELTYSTGSVTVESQTDKFAASSEGKAVLLYSYAPAATSVATGDASREAYVTRIVDSRNIADARQSSEVLSVTNKTVVQFDGATNHFLEIVPPANGGFLEFVDGATRTVDFWCRKDSSTSTEPRIIWEQSGTGGVGVALLQMGFRADNDSINPGGFFFDVANSGFHLLEDFSSSTPSGTYLNGNAKVTNGILVLTDAAANQGGNFTIDDLNSGAAVTSMKVKFKVRSGGGTATPGDGFSFNFGPSLSTNNYNEEGQGSGLQVRFDAYDNGGTDTAPSIEVAYANQTLSTNSFAGTRSGGRASATTIVTNSAGQQLNLNTTNEYVEVTISLDSSGKVAVTWAGTVVVTNLATSFTSATAWRISFGARTGTAYQTHYIDDLAISLNNSGSEAVTIASKDFSDLDIDDSWHHWAVTTTNNLYSFYLDGMFVGSMSATLGYDADDFTRCVLGRSLHESFGPLGELDNLRVWNRTLSVDEIRAYMLTANPSDTNDLEINAQFDTTPTSTKFPHVGVNSASITNSNPASMLAYSADAPVEVASRILSRLDTAGLDSGFIVNKVSNYNPAIYNREAEVGAWGGIYPVNWSGLFTDSKALEVVWYENPYNVLPASSNVLHPNVNWPYIAVSYDDVDFPSVRENKDKRIYIASRLGSEGVDANGSDQLVFDPAAYSELTVYHQPDPAEAGYNPNEEHALIAPSIKDQITGDTTFNLSQNAAFALQNGLNSTSQVSQTTYTSEPWVLVQYRNLDSDELEMAAYKVEETRTGSASFPALDSNTHLSVDDLGQPVAQPTNPTYDFNYTTFAGDVLIPPYPLNLVIGNVTMSKNWGGQIGSQATLWKDINGNYWTISGDGAFFFRYWYPFSDDFWYDTDRDGDNDLTTGTAFAWLPADGLYTGNTSTNAQIVRYASYWRDSYPTLKRGETLTYAGGEYKAENSSAEGLPAIVGFASAQIVFDSAWKWMVFDNAILSSGKNVMDQYSARVIRPLDRIEVSVSQSQMPTQLTPAFTDNIMVVAERWYFKALTGSLQKRIYYDSLRSKLVFRGRLNDLESGDPDLTATPVSTYILEPNVMTKNEYDSIASLSSDSIWRSAVQSIFLQSQDPNGTGIGVTDTVQKFYAGMEPQGNAYVTQPSFYSYQPASDTVVNIDGTIPALFGLLGITNNYQHLNSLGSGSAVIPNASMLTNNNTSDFYITVAENNHPDAGGAISLHIIRIGQERYRGSIKVVEAQNVFDEKINLKHSGDFGGNTEDVYYQWWVREVASLDSVGLPGEDTAWQLYTQGLGLNTIAFSGRPDVMLGDKLFYVRYGGSNELKTVTGVSNVITDDPSTASVDDDSWRLVDFTDGVWTPTNFSPVPFQWGGAANSPQAQADGSKKYIPQLVMGWVKRVLDRVNPYEARYSDFYGNESPATYSSMLQIAGKPFVGKVALNSDKDVIENVGLIELYETVLKRAKELSLNIVGGSTSGTDQALLLAATRLAFLYELLAREAYTDAQNPLIRVTETNGLGLFASYVHAFYNQQATLLDEELGLLRGTDFLKAYPAYNRLFWNYVKGEGEAAYNANYNIYDVTTDGFINEFDAATLYPQGHGDAWGHFLSANSMHYELLRHTAFDWESRAELYSLLDNVIKADYLDEKSFARIAAAKARTGLEVLKATYRKAYTEDPDGQWQGYTDSDSARAWGVSEWAKRTGQAALFDWIVGNALVPSISKNGVLEDLDRVDRVVNKTELSEIAATCVTIQNALDEANNGHNPIGLDRDAVVFDIDPLQYDGTGGNRQTHFEQAYAKAISAAQNALAALEQASRADYQLQRIADNTISLQTEALRHDLDYRNRLIEIFGTPYDGTIGPGEVFDEGYAGPDTLLYLYIDRTDTSDLIPDPDSRFVTLTNTSFSQWANDRSSLDWDPNFAEIDDTVNDIFDRFYLTEHFVDVVLGESTNSSVQELTIDAPVRSTGDYAFQAEKDWGSRTSYGKIQTILGELLHEEVALEKSVRDYAAYIEQVKLLGERLSTELRATQKKESVRSSSGAALLALETVRGVAGLIEAFSQWGWDFAWQSAVMAQEYFPKVLGFANDATAPARGAAYSVGLTFRSPLMLKWTLAMLTRQGAEAGTELVRAMASSDEVLINEFREMNAIVSEMGMLLTQEEGKRLAIAQHVQRMQMLAEKLQSAKAEGFRLLDEREAYNISLAGQVQRNRYRDMALRLSRNEALTQYQSAFDNALRYAWLAAKAYDYETSLDEGDPAAATTLLEEIIKCRSLGLWHNGQPRVGQGGIAHHMARMKANFDTLEGQLGINNPQIETDRLSLRHEHFRIATNAATSNERWRQTLQAARVSDLWSVPEFVKYCRPFSNPGSAEPGIVIEFSTEINSGKNVFGRWLGGADHSYSSANFATKVRSLGVWFENYNATGLSTSPRVYLVPVGADVLRVANADFPTTRSWNVVEQRIPVPFIINQSDLDSPNFIPSVHSLDGSFAEIRRFGDFRAYHTSGGSAIDTSQLTRSSRLIGRSLWNTRWLLIIPGATLHSDTEYGLEHFVNGVTDIKLVFETYTHEGN